MIYHFLVRANESATRVLKMRIIPIKNRGQKLDSGMTFGWIVHVQNGKFPFLITVASQMPH
jgi:hypothetical protein